MDDPFLMSMNISRASNLIIDSFSTLDVGSIDFNYLLVFSTPVFTAPAAAAAATSIIRLPTVFDKKLS